MILSFTVPGPVRPKARPRLGSRGNVYTPKATHNYEATVRVHAMAAMAKQGWSRTGDPCAVTARVFWKDHRRQDLDNAVKNLDALNGMVWTDDSQVVELHVYGSVDSDRPRLELEVTNLRSRA